jgi:hypothetical protein
VEDEMFAAIEQRIRRQRFIADVKEAAYVFFQVSFLVLAGVAAIVFAYLLVISAWRMFS